MKKIVLFVVVTCCGCFFDGGSKFEITDSYQVYENDSGQFQLVCKLGCEGDSLIENVKMIEWNDKAILVKTKKEDELYLVVAKGEKLLCCNRDIHLGPFKQSSLDSIKIQYEVGVFDKNKSF
jgi:hypothetical protein